MAGTKPPTGRPSKLTPELQQQIVQLITAGCYPEVAAGACGISRTTFYEWMQRAAGEHPDRPATDELLAFADAISEAVDKSEARLVLRLAEYIEGRRKGKRKPWVKSRIGTGQVIAMQWQLSRRFPDRWGARPPALNVGVMPTGGEGDSAPKGVTISVVYPTDLEAEPT